VSRAQQLQWAIEFLPVRWAGASDPISRRRDLGVARGLKYHEGLYDFLAPRREAARIDEAKNAVVVQVVGKAVEPERKSSPKRLLIIAIAAALLFLLACFVILVRETIQRKKQDPVEAQGLATLNQYLGSLF
jgi:uncharacterized membrane protein YedE/YeeE